MANPTHIPARENSTIESQAQAKDQDAAAPFRKDITSYFDISGLSHGNGTADISSETQLRRHSPTTATRRPYFRFYSDFDALQKCYTTTPPKETRPPLTHSLRFEVTLSPKPGADQSLDASSLPSSPCTSAPSAETSPPWGSRPSKEKHSYLRHRPKLRRILATSPSWDVGLEGREASAGSVRRLSSTASEAQTSVGDIIVVRTDQTPLTPPSRSFPTTEMPTPSSIRVETEFPEHRSSSHSPQRGTHSHSSEQQSQTSSRRSSMTPKVVLATPLKYIRQASPLKQSRTTTKTEAPQSTPVGRDRRMADHTSQIKRNYTLEALELVTGILQEIKLAPPSSLWLSQVIKPLRWRTSSNKSPSHQKKNEPRTMQGIISEINDNHKGSGELLSGLQSYTSSQINLRMGNVPMNTPDETATYKIKRSPSAETEEYFRVDISIRGGTSYLPSEARRIHTPPLPEAGLDGRLKGFFFDYNAPGRSVCLRGTETPEGAVDSVSTNQDSSGTSGHSRTMPAGKKPGKIKSKNKRILAGDWYDVKLAEVDMNIQADKGEMNHAKQGEKRVNSPQCLHKIRKNQRDAAEFDLTIPEHLPNSPLCPRHTKYWRVVRERGSQFRGCWMHGLGIFQAEPSQSN
ncbi:hypothetical protein AYO21_01863 [Fonsecaea monophora]|uniref:Uncharacterized protein n=1 Tax=Fonsecaea monophora TaxID=254056 RepID=A0A177FJR0_9EURO|nr:hypothetical protein AYO21_01863 [Fonsecaea monophora]KAH0831664.1 hypothetical protein FOPE_02779 [Fonsecaea pedrosoi]OAG44011.1 hypothetical protein AYO21_01863 [Fonsecaea monophora]